MTMVSDHRDTEVLGGMGGGLRRDEVAETVANLLDDVDQRGIDIRIQPEPTPDGDEYVVGWRYLQYNRHEMRWTPLMERGDAHD